MMKIETGRKSGGFLEGVLQPALFKKNRLTPTLGKMLITFIWIYENKLVIL
jgi:hypothetical protein